MPPSLGIPSSTSTVISSTSASSVTSSSTTSAASMTSSSSSSPSSTASGAVSSGSPGQKTNTGAIAGGVVGGFVLASVLAGLVAFWLNRRRKSDETREPLDEPGQRQSAYAETASNAHSPPVSYQRDSFYGNPNVSKAP